MKIHTRFLFGIMASFLCLCDADAKNTEVGTTKICPAGMFCTAGGKYVVRDEYGISGLLGPAELANGIQETNIGVCFDRKYGEKNGCNYYIEDYDETWFSRALGYYFVKNGEVTYFGYTDSRAKGMFGCPGTYPSSEEGAISVFECYRVVSNGQKEYYKAPTGYSGNCSIEGIGNLVRNLQSALDQANKAAQDLQAALNNANQKKAVNTESAKAMISAGITDKMSIDNQKMASKPAKNDIEGAKALIRSGVTETHGAVKAAKRTRD